MKGRTTTIVIPAKAGIQLHVSNILSWTPTFVGVTSGERGTNEGRS